MKTTKKKPALTSPFARWMQLVGFKTSQPEKAGATLGMARTTSRKCRDGTRELWLTERLAMSALRAGLEPWSPKIDEDLVKLAPAPLAEPAETTA